MFFRDDLLEIKKAGEKILHQERALVAGTSLKDHRYEIVHLESIMDTCLSYKGIDLDSGDFVILKEFFPKEAFGYEGAIYFERNLDTLKLEVKNSNAKIINDVLDLMNNFIEEIKYKEKMVISPPLTKVIDSFHDFGTVYVVTTYNEWPSLEMVLKSDYNLDFETLNQWVNDLIKQVKPFHKRDIVHRRLNPKNIFATEAGLVIDGLSLGETIKILKEDADKNRYLSPEIIENTNKVGTWSDVYALCKILIDMLIKFSDGKGYYHALDQLPNHEVKEAYSKGIKKGIAIKIEDRYKTVMALDEVLNPVKIIGKKIKPPKRMVAIILVLSVMSSSWLFFRMNPIMDQGNEAYRIIDEEPTALGPLEPVFFILPETKVFSLKDLTISWFKTTDVEVTSFLLLENEKLLIEKTLTRNQMSVNLSQYSLSEGVYTARLSYKLDQKKYTIDLNMTIRP